MLARVDDTPLWAILLIGLGSGALGAFMTTWYRAQHERKEAERERKTQACADFLTAQQALMAATRDTLDHLTTHSYTRLPSDRLAPTVAAGDVLLGAHLRLVLLFGPDSEICRTTEEVVRHGTEINHGLREMPPNFTRAHSNLIAAGDLLDDAFMAKAHAALSARWRRA
jgi:hypothetical protein